MTTTASGAPGLDPRNRRANLLAILFLLLLPVVFFARGLRPSRTIIQTDELRLHSPWCTGTAAALAHHTRGHPDLPNQVYPLEVFARRSLARGESPFLWNPWILCGTRNILCSPIRSLFFWVPALLLPLPLSHGLTVVLLLQAMGVFTFLWLRALGAGAAGAALGAAAYAGNVSFLVWAYPENLESCTWLPAVLLCVEQYWRGGRVRWIGAGSLAVGLQALAGWPGFTLLAWLFVAAYALVRRRPSGGPGAAVSRWWERLAPFAMLAIGLAIAAVQLIPLWLWQPWTQRAVGEAFAGRDASFYRAPLAYAASFWSPAFPGTHWTRWWYEVAGYAGIGGLLLAAYAMIRRGGTRRIPRELLWLALLFGLIAYDGPVSRAMRVLPGLHVSTLGRASFLLVLVIGALAAFGFERLREEDPSRWPWSRVWMALAGSAACAAAIHLGLLGLLHGQAANLEMDPELAERFYRAGTSEHWHPLILLPAFLAIVVLWRVGRLRGAGLVVAILAVHAVDLESASWRYLVPGHTAELFPPRGWAVKLREATERPRVRAVAVSEGPYAGNHLLSYGIESATGYTSLFDARTWRFFDARLRVVPSVANTVYLDPKLPPETALRDLGFLNVRWVLSRAGLRGRLADLRLRIPFRAARGRGDRRGGAGGGLRLPSGWPPDLFLYENPHWTPRVARQHAVRWAGNGDEAFRIVTRPGFIPGRMVVLEHPEGSGEGGAAGAPNGEREDPGGSSAWESPRPGMPRGAIRVVSRGNNHVVIDTIGLTPAYVVLRETFDPGWSVAVDGKPAEALRADYLFRAVRVPAGRHRVTWQFRLPGLRPAAAVTAAGLLAAWILLLWRPRSSSRRGPPAAAPRGPREPRSASMSIP